MNLEKFKLLCWKNFTLQKRHPIAGAFEILFPILIVGLFALARENTNSNEIPPINFGSFEPTDYRECQSFNNEQVTIIGISPNSSRPVVDIVQSSIGKYLQIDWFENAAALNEWLESENVTVAGIEFDDALAVSAIKYN